MKKILFCLMISPYFLVAQFGVKAGLNFANITKASSINNSSHTGFNVGIFLAPSSKRIFSSKTELIFSRQGYDYKTSTNTGNVNLDYVMMPQYLCINITKFVQIQLGGQMAILVSAKSGGEAASPIGGQLGKIMDYYNRFDYGYGGGVEIHPISGLLVGAKMNISLSNLYKNAFDPTLGTTPSFIPNVDVKNNLFQVFAGWRFGKRKE